MKLILIVVVAATGGAMLGDLIDREVGDKISTKPSTRKAVRTGFTAGSAALIFGVLNSVIGR